MTGVGLPPVEAISLDGTETTAASAGNGSVNAATTRTFIASLTVTRADVENVLKNVGENITVLLFRSVEAPYF